MTMSQNVVNLESVFAPNTIVDLGKRTLKLSGSKIEHTYTLMVDISGMKVKDVISVDMAVKFANAQRSTFVDDKEASKILDKKTLVLGYKDLGVALGSKKPQSKSRIQVMKEMVDAGLVTAEDLVKKGYISSVSDLS